MDQELVSEFQKILEQNRLAHAYLFEGGRQNDRRDFALFLAKSQFCTQLKNNLPCGQCVACKNIDLGDNPDVIELKSDKRSIGIDDARLYKETMARSSQGNVKVLIIDDAQKLTPQAANNLLKFIEEPDGEVLIILLADYRTQILPTILSRVQSFQVSETLNNSQVEQLISEGFSKKNALLFQKISKAGYLTDITATDFEKLITALSDWYVKCISADTNAFINVQRQIKPLVTNRHQQELAWDIMGYLFQDTLNLKYKSGNTNLLNSSFNIELVNNNLTQWIDSYLLAVEQWKSNVAFQACLESLTLTFLDS